MLTRGVSRAPGGVYRIVWGSGYNALYAVIDVANRRSVEDANPANEGNQPLVRERWRMTFVTRPILAL